MQSQKIQFFFVDAESEYQNFKFDRIFDNITVIQRFEY